MEHDEVKDRPLAATAEAALPEGGRFHLGAVLTATAAHFTHDLYPSFIGPLLPLLIQKHGLTLSAAGALATVNRWPGVLMPFMGYVADRYDSRIFIIWGPTATALAVTSIGLAPNYIALMVVLLVAGFSSSAFHPAASTLATDASGRQRGRGSSYFMTGGELSRTVGPPFIVAIVTTFSLEAAWLAAIPAFIMSYFSYRQVSRLGRHFTRAAQPPNLLAVMRERSGALLILAGVVTFRSLVIASFQAFYATYLTTIGQDLIYAGFALAVYEAGGTVGAFIGGQISDRIGRRQMMGLSQLIAGPLLYGSLVWGATPAGLAFLFFGGMLALSAGAVQLALAQELLPRNRSAASGIMMFLSFEGTVFASILIGFVADAVGLESALVWSVLASMLSLPFTYMLPETRSGVERSGH
ncbi:MAG: MFS transporter [Chloroflexota bacterium]